MPFKQHSIATTRVTPTVRNKRFASRIVWLLACVLYVFYPTFANAEKVPQPAQSAFLQQLELARQCTESIHGRGTPRSISASQNLKGISSDVLDSILVSASANGDILTPTGGSSLELLKDLTEACKEELPTEQLEIKYLEGMAKRVPINRISIAIKRMKNKMHTGKMLLQKHCSASPRDTLSSLYIAISKGLTAETVEQLLAECGTDSGESSICSTANSQCMQVILFAAQLYKAGLSQENAARVAVACSHSGKNLASYSGLSSILAISLRNHGDNRDTQEITIVETILPLLKDEEITLADIAERMGITLRDTASGIRIGDHQKR